MPILNSKPVDDDDEGAIRSHLLSAIHSSEPCESDFVSPSVIKALEAEFLSEGHVRHEERVREYVSLASRTSDLKLLQVLRVHPEGRLLFEELCLRLDINQSYGDILPGWKDLAGILEIDSLKTHWVEVCVRPMEGLTRAILEVYTRDGGTLGDVLSALIQMECLQVLESLKPKIYSFMKAYQFSKESSLNTAMPCFSVLKGLSGIFPPDDPCHVFQEFSNGLKNYKLCQDSPVNMECNQLFTSEFNEASKPLCSREWDKPKMESQKTKVCNIFLLFASDGINYGSTMQSLLQGFEHAGVRIEVFRLNEVSLWYEVLNNPEACCMKWANEADYIMPVLTPQLMQDFHSGTSQEADSLLPTSPILNHYLYTLARARYTENACRNTMVRPIIPMEYLKSLGQSQVVRRDPLLRLVWVPLKEERVLARAKGMLTEFAKRV